VGLLVSYVKEYNQKFKKFVVYTEGSLPLISGLYMDIVESPAYIQLCEILHILELGHKFKD